MGWRDVHRTPQTQASGENTGDVVVIQDSPVASIVCRSSHMIAPSTNLNDCRNQEMDHDGISSGSRNYSPPFCDSISSLLFYLAEYVRQAVYTFIPVTIGRNLSVAATMGPDTTKPRLSKPVVTVYEQMPS